MLVIEYKLCSYVRQVTGGRNQTCCPSSFECFGSIFVDVDDASGIILSFSNCFSYSNTSHLAFLNLFLKPAIASAH